jgi:hypothetical protein
MPVSPGTSGMVEVIIHALRLQNYYLPHPCVYDRAKRSMKNKNQRDHPPQAAHSFASILNI